MLSARAIYIALFLTVYFLNIYWWFINPYDSLEKEIEEPKEIIKIAESPIFDSMTLKLLNVEYQERQFVSRGESDYNQYAQDVVARGAIALPTLLFYLKNTDDFEIQNNLFHMICEINDSSLRMELEDILKVGSNRLRLLCIEKIGDRDFKESAALLKTMLINKKPSDSEYMPIANALVKLGDKISARIAFEEYLKTGLDRFRYDVIENISDLGFKELIPVLKGQLKNLKPENDEYFQIHKCLLKLSDSSFLGELINLGLHLKIHQMEVIDALNSFQPIRDRFRSLENGEYIGLLIEDELILKAIDEWYHEKILKKPSPYESTKEPQFSEPYALEKKNAWNFLLQVMSKNTFNPLGLRVHFNDIKIAELDFQLEITLISGAGHGGSMNIYVCSPKLNEVEMFQFSYSIRAKEFDCFSKKMDIKSYKELIIGLKTILNARIEPWWSDSSHYRIRSTANFIISFVGLLNESTEITGYCGHLRADSEIDYIKLVAAEKLFREICKIENFTAESEVLPEARSIFSKVFVQALNNRYHGWVRSCLIDMSSEFGDKHLIEFLIKILTNAYTEKKNNLASSAIDAISKISKKDFRYKEDGSLKDIDSIVKDYIEWYKDIQPTGQ